MATQIIIADIPSLMSINDEYEDVQMRYVEALRANRAMCNHGIITEREYIRRFHWLADKFMRLPTARRQRFACNAIRHLSKEFIDDYCKH